MDAGGREENTADSFVLLWENWGMNCVNGLFFLSVVGLNIFGLMVTSRLGSVFRAVLLTSRTALVSFLLASPPAKTSRRQYPSMYLRGEQWGDVQQMRGHPRLLDDR